MTEAQLPDYMRDLLEDVGEASSDEVVNPMSDDEVELIPGQEPQVSSSGDSEKMKLTKGMLRIMRGYHPTKPGETFH